MNTFVSRNLLLLTFHHLIGRLLDFIFHHTFVLFLYLIIFGG